MAALYERISWQSLRPVTGGCRPHNRGLACGLAGIPPFGNQRGACLERWPPPPADRQSSTITGPFPYGRYALNPHLSFRALLGYGTGDLALSPSRQEQMGTTINLSLAAVGLDGVLLDGGATGLTISSSADGLFLQTGSEKADGLAAAEEDLSRLRLALAASRPFPLDHQSSWLTPALELGLRQDSGDAETGFGLDLAASLHWLAAEHGMAVAVKGRRLLSHGAEGEWQDQGLSASLSWDPTPSSPLGHSLSVCRNWGGSAVAGVDALLSPDAFPSLGGAASSAEGDRQALEAALAYGFPVHGDALVLTL